MQPGGLEQRRRQARALVSDQESRWSAQVQVVERVRRTPDQRDRLATESACVGDEVHGDRPGRLDLAEGLPETELARAAQDDRLAVVGSRSYGSVRRSVLGSTSAGLLELARVPVIVCPRTTQVPHTMAEPASELAAI